jgi:hypothetical protein
LIIISEGLTGKVVPEVCSFLKMQTRASVDTAINNKTIKLLTIMRMYLGRIGVEIFAWTATPQILVVTAHPKEVFTC